MIYGNITYATLTGGGNGGNAYQVRFGYEILSEDIANNSRQVKLQLEVRSVKSAYGTYGFNQTSTIDGSVLSSTTFDMRNTNVWQIFGSRTITISGEYSGTKTGSFTTNATTSSGNYTLKSGSANVYISLASLHQPPLIQTAEVSELNTVVSNLNIPATTVVRYLSKKRFTLHATAYDSATLTYRIRGLAYDSSKQASNVIDVDFRTDAQNVTFKNNTVQLTQYIYDSLGGSSQDDIIVSINNTPSVLNIIDYAKPTLEKTSTTIKRKSGNGTNLTDNKANINVVGTIYKGNNAIGNNNAIRTIGYKVWERGTSEPTNYTSFSTTPTPSSSGAVAITDYEISNIDFTKAYNYKIILGDNYSNGTTYYTDVVEGTISLGQPTWSEYKDRVDFLEITTKNKYLSNIGDTIKAYCSASQNISPQTTAVINIDTIDYNTSSKLSLSNNAIYIGENVHTILVNCRWTAWTPTSNGRYIYIYKNGTLVAFNTRAYSSTMETSAVIPVEENDYIEMKSYHEQPSSISINANKTQTFIQVTILG